LHEGQAAQQREHAEEVQQQARLARERIPPMMKPYKLN